ncbi:MAG: pilus assembly protein, partial [Lautropia mirabilis]
MAVNDSKAGRHDSVEHCPGIQAGAGKAVRLALFLMACAGAGAVQAEIAQHSLIVATPPVVEPNVMFTLDDSGSMLFNYLPDTDLPYQIYAIHPQEPAKIAYFGIAGLLDSRDGNILSARRRSSDVNLLYYNPKVRYMPWMNADGTREPDADPGAVHYFYKHAGDRTLNLRGLQPVAGSAHQVCAASVQRGAKCVPFAWGQAPAQVKPATYYVLTGVNRNDPASYRRVSIADHQEFDIETTDRTECRQKSPGVRTCTQEQEYKNFANWFQYHRFRYLLAVGAVGEAFARQLGGDVRVGYGRINKGEGQVDGIATRVVERGVRRFDGQDKTAFFSWLQSVNPSGSTPLLGASIAVGEYFKRDGAQGPWSDTDRKGQTRQLSCRRSYHILMTDGQYNDQENTQIDRIPGMSNADNELGPVIPASGKNRAFRYDPNDPNNRLYRSATGRTLADVAMYYWNRDLMPNLANNVPVDADNPSFWQNVTMYTLSFGADGTLPASTPEAQTSTLQE